MAELQYVELMGDTQRLWWKLPPRIKEDIRADFDFISRIDGSKVLFREGTVDDELPNELPTFESALLERLRKANPYTDIRALNLRYRHRRESFANFISGIEGYARKFASLDFGSDVAEQDEHLLQYFLKTSAYARVAKFQKGIVIGPKGSGKSSILRALAADSPSSNVIVITPEVFATSMLKKVVEEGADAWEEERAFAATWEFSILFEVFKHISMNPRNIPKPALTEVRKFLSKYSDFDNDDLFLRFLLYLQKIQSVKLAGIEFGVKTRQLQELYSLEPLYDLILRIRKYLRANMLILIDELDQGWDNSENSNRFLAGLLQAAVQIHNLGIQAHVIVFVRSEIFDLVRNKLAQLDKIRSGIEHLKWSDGELMNLVFRRIAHHFGSALLRYAPMEMLVLMFESTGGTSGFEYILSRTTKRPREVLQLTRLAHQHANDSGQNRILSEAISKAEDEFSVWKLEHVCAEYLHIYPDIELLLRGFRGRQARVGRVDIEEVIEDLRSSRPDLQFWMNKETDHIVQILYQIEFVGVKRSAPNRNAIRDLSEFEFAYESAYPNLSKSEEFLIHPAFWKGLDVL